MVLVLVVATMTEVGCSLMRVVVAALVVVLVVGSGGGGGGGSREPSVNDG